MAVYWGWVVWMSFLVLMVLCISIAYSFGEIVLSIVNDPVMNTSLIEMSWVGALSTCIPALAAPLAAWLNFKIGTRRVVFSGVFLATISVALTPLARSVYWMFTVYGILSGVGMLFIVVPPYFLLAEYFPYHHPRHVLVTSSIMSAWPIATMVTNPVTYALLSAVGWRMTYSVFAVTLFFVGCCTAATFRPTTQQEQQELTRQLVAGTNEEAGQLTLRLTDGTETNKHVGEYSEMKTHDVQPLHIKTVIILCVVWFLAAFMKCTPYSTHYMTLVTVMNSVGITQDKASYAMAIMGACELMSRGFMSYVGDRIKGNMLQTYVVFTAILCLVNVVGSLATTLEHFLLFTAVLGVFDGPIVAAMYSSCFEVLQGEQVPVVYSIFRVGFGFGQLIGPNLAVMTYEMTGSFRGSFYVNSAQYGLAALLYTLLIVLHKTRPSWCFPQATTDTQSQPHIHSGSNNSVEH